MELTGSKRLDLSNELSYPTTNEEFKAYEAATAPAALAASRATAFPPLVFRLCGNYFPSIEDPSKCELCDMDLLVVLLLADSRSLVREKIAQCARGRTSKACWGWENIGRRGV